MRLSSVDAATADLRCDSLPWLRGHAAEHRLIPALFRFPNGPERERLLIERSLAQYGIPSKQMVRSLHALVALHHRYVPTRLLAWTRSLHVALFCALIREQGRPTLFVMNPTILNAISGVSGTDLDVVPDAELAHPTRTHPVAFELMGAVDGVSEHLFTLHGSNSAPLEEQCPTCVRKVMLSDQEAASARDYILSVEWSHGMHLPVR